MTHIPHLQCVNITFMALSPHSHCVNTTFMTHSPHSHCGLLLTPATGTPAADEKKNQDQIKSSQVPFSFYKHHIYDTLTTFSLYKHHIYDTLPTFSLCKHHIYDTFSLCKYYIYMTLSPHSQLETSR